MRVIWAVLQWTAIIVVIALACGIGLWKLLQHGLHEDEWPR